MAFEFKWSKPETAVPQQTGNLIKRKNKKDNLTSNKPQTPHSLFSVPRKNVYVNAVSGKSFNEKLFSDDKKFGNLQIHKYLVSNLVKHNFEVMTTVQERAIPEILAGKNVLVRSQTGSGKTLAYAVPLLNKLLEQTPKLTRNAGIQAIVVVPTRELALQTHEIFTKINTFQWIIVSHLCGGESRKTEKDRLRKGVHILIGTPGRLLDHILHTTAFNSQSVKFLVMDEADRLLDMGFRKDIERIVQEIDNSAKYNPLDLLKKQHNEEEDKERVEKQTVLLSATLTKQIGELANFAMKDHVYIDSLDISNPAHLVIPQSVNQEFIVTYAKHRLFTLSAILVSMEKQKVFVFMATGQMVDYHYELFTKYLVKVEKENGEQEVVLETNFYKLHGSMDQSERKKVFAGFKAAKSGILLCTDVAARGVDVPAADTIIQYTGPQSDQDYLHRVGRTGRAGKSGSALIFLTHEEQEYVAKLQKHKVFLKERKADEYLRKLAIALEARDSESAASLLQKHYEGALAANRALHQLACFAYSSWSRFYNTFPAELREFFNFKNVNLGHYVTSFGLKESPSSVARVIRGKVQHFVPKKLNSKLATDDSDDVKIAQKRKNTVRSRDVSEFGSGLAPRKKRKTQK